ncbi:hypothetical protein [Actinokineospora bangkokensis]|uniref:Uncharacterized protein n=1 Tax=Actinokineospora bangkokensis TaxID=1193682 RepID=A0A1Q9LBY0_9PSEU|nr:hypothetical protein [Actinokineospora bangkokensis]OLR89537.1 hypothetical protein BJP25_05525 [Actinokineospora bangkokensis]
MSYQMSDEQWAEHRGYADQVQIVVTPMDNPSALEHLEQWIVISHGAAWTPDWLLRKVESIPLSTNSELGSAPYILTSTENRTSWGADSATYEILLGISTWAATSAAWDLLKIVSKEMAVRLKAEHPGMIETDLNEHEAIERTRWLVASRYDTPVDQLQVVETDLDAEGQARVVLDDGNGWLYDVTLELCDGLVYLSRIKRTKKRAADRKDSSVQ